MTIAPIGLAILVFVVVLILLNRFVGRLQGEQIAHPWAERERCRDPGSRPRSGHERSRVGWDR